MGRRTLMWLLVPMPPRIPAPRYTVTPVCVAGGACAAARSGPWIRGHADVSGVRLHYAEMGSGPLVVLLHGFPQCWYQWRYVMPRLAEQFHVVAVDMRGYNMSDKPEGVRSYRTDVI